MSGQQTHGTAAKTHVVTAEICALVGALVECLSIPRHTALLLYSWVSHVANLKLGLAPRKSLVQGKAGTVECYGLLHDGKPCMLVALVQPVCRFVAVCYGVQAVVQGKWLVIEDLNLAPPEVLAALVPLLANRQLHLPQRAQVIKAAPSFQLLASITTAPGGFKRANPAITNLMLLVH